MRFALLAMLVGLGCDSNPTPHPSRNGVDGATAETTGGGGAPDTLDPGVDNQDPDDFADALAPTAEAGADAADAADGGPDGDDNETTISDDTSPASDGPAAPDAPR